MTIPGYIPAIGETDLNKIVRSIRNLYENGASTNDLVGGISAHYFGSSVHLAYVSTTALKLAPFNGDQYKANGVLCSVSSSGVSIANTSVRVNGSVTDLAASTAYYISINSGGTPGFWAASTYSHAPDTTTGNVGVEVITLSGTPSSDEALIGWCQTDGSKHFQNTTSARLVASWFNRQPTNITGNTGGTVTTASVTFVELASAARCNFFSWGDAFFGSIGGVAFNNTASSACLASVGMDASAVGMAGQILMTNANDRGDPATSYSAVLSEGAHTASIFGRVSAGTGSFNMQLEGIVWI